MNADRSRHKFAIKDDDDDDDDDDDSGGEYKNQFV